MNKFKVSENFMLYEFQCKSTGEVKLEEALIEKLQKLRDLIGKPIVVHSGYRTPEYNATLQGAAQDSFHMKGMAADISVKGMTPDEVAKLAEKVGFNGIGVYKTFTHCDVRSYKARWRG